MIRERARFPVWVGFFVLAAGVLASQEATEQFIPIGRSPDLSNRVTVIGTLTEIDTQTRTIVVDGDGVTATAEITEETRIFLDKSKLRETNTMGDIDDLEEGARVEVLYEGRRRASSGPAEWIKIEVAR